MKNKAIWDFLLILFFSLKSTGMNTALFYTKLQIWHLSEVIIISSYHMQNSQHNWGSKDQNTIFIVFQ